MEANRIAVGAAASDSETSLDSEKAAGHFAAVITPVITALSRESKIARDTAAETV